MIFDIPNVHFETAVAIYPQLNNLLLTSKDRTESLKTYQIIERYCYTKMRASWSRSGYLEAEVIRSIN